MARASTLKILQITIILIIALEQIKSPGPLAVNAYLPLKLID